MKKEYVALKSLLEHPGWSILQALFVAQVSKIEEARNRAAKNGQESAWRYWAGQEYGAKLMTMIPERAIADMEKENAELATESNYESMVREILKT